MISEDYVSFEIAKLLKEKGFDEATYHDYSEKGTRWFQDVLVCHNSQGGVACPTLQMAMKWLRDVHNLIISVKFTVHGWLCDITKIIRDSNGFIININHGICDDSLHYCDEYEEACEAAIKFCLENLV